MATLDFQPQVGSTSEFFRFEATRKLNPVDRARLGQYMTPASIGGFMAGMFQNLEGRLRILDPGAGVGSLTAAVADQIRQLDYRPQELSMVAYEIDSILVDYLRTTMDKSIQSCVSVGIPAAGEVRADDFVQVCCELLGPNLFTDVDVDYTRFSHVIMNPPYGKIRSGSETSIALRRVGIDVPNFYAAFLLLAAKLLRHGGEMVAIVPRSFCNGTYFRSFRRQFFALMAIKGIHVFNQRDSAFRDDDVLQENVIIHAVRSSSPTTVKISSSHGSDFFFDSVSSEWITEDFTERIVGHSSVLDPDDPNHLIRIESTGLDQDVVKLIDRFPASLTDIGVEVSTGPVVDFRLKSELLSDPTFGTAPLLYPTHFTDGILVWPKKTKKPNAIQVSEKSRRWLWRNSGHFVVTKRFTSKEEPKRIVASVYASDLPGDLVGFENHLNVYHCKQNGLNRSLAIGLSNYLNSSLLDSYFRVFSGHTQVNATDLRTIPYPTRDVLESIGRQSGGGRLSQQAIDEIIGEHIPGMQDHSNPVAAQEKIHQALEVLKNLEVPPKLIHDRSALTLLALVDLKPEGSWSSLKRPLIGITPIIDFCREHYEREYAPNTREAFRRNTMHQFVEAGIARRNPDDPDRPRNSPRTCYQISRDVEELLRSFGTDSWDENLAGYAEEHNSLAEIWRQDREMRMIPIQMDADVTINLSPRAHSELIDQVITQFAPRFVPSGQIIYVGDTGDKMAFFSSQLLEKLGVSVDPRGRVPDVIPYDRERNWLLLIEAVTSHGPVDPKRQTELAAVFGNSTAGIVYLTAFQNRSVMARFLSRISWETEVWCADDPSHLIHFDGDSFLGPFRN